MSHELMRVLLYLLTLSTGFLVGRVLVYRRENQELRTKLRRSRVEKVEVEKAGFTQVSATAEGYVKLSMAPGLPPGTSLEAVVYTPAQADQLVEAIGRVRRVASAMSTTWIKNPKPMVN